MSVVKSIYLILGFLSFALGVIGIFLPIMPTTPFILLAAFCFSRSSERIYHWFINHKLFGKVIIDWNIHGVISLKSKLLVTILLPPSLIYSIFFKEFPPMIDATIAIVGVIILGFIWSRPSQRRSHQTT